jgi:3'(2'), 5'-bisphosphate nucleotidase
MNLHQLLDPVLAIGRQAGAAILDIYQRADHEVQSKADQSPLTAADLAAHRLIVAALQALTPALPVLSEEAADIAWDERRHWQRYWLVDPLDGTREFIQRNGEFTVNIALIEQGAPVLGVVHVPVSGLSYAGVRGLGAWKEGPLSRVPIRTQALAEHQRSLRVVASRNHRGAVLDAWLLRLQAAYPALELLSMGSSLKICLVAEGRADLYPRLAPTAEWDTAAAQAVLEAAGGRLVDLQNRDYRYNRKADLLNPWFCAIGDAGRDFSVLLAPGATGGAE